KKSRIYSKLPAAGPVLLGLPKGEFSPALVEIPRRSEGVARFDGDFHRSADQLLLEKYAPPGVVVDLDLEILQFRGRTAPFLEPSPGQPNHNLVKMVHPQLVPVLRLLFQSARKKNMAARKENLAVKLEGQPTKLSLEVAPLNPGAPEKDRRFLVVFEELPKTVGRKSEKTRGTKPKGGTRSAEDSGSPSFKDQHIGQLQHELDNQRESQQSLIEQFDSMQEELRAANEELQATNEELQATNEELETAQEELQASNEELTTMNDELHGRNAELASLNEKLASSEERFRMMVEGVRDYAIFMLDPDGKVASWNEGARRFKGYEAQDILGESFAKFYPAEDVVAGKPERELERARVDGRVEDEGWRLRKDGTRFWANVILSRINDHSGKLLGFCQVTRDLTEKRKTEEELRASEQRFRLMVGAIKEYAVFMLDVDGNVVSWNEGARRLKGYEPSEIIGTHFSRFYAPEDVARRHPEEELRAAMRDGKYQEEGWRIRKDGSQFWASVVISRIDDASGRPVGFAKITRDLTERRLAEEALRHTNESLEQRVRERTDELELAVRARDEFLSIASHELKTPLTSLKLQLQMTRRKTRPEERVAPSAEDIASALDLGLRQADSLANLIESLLDVARIQTGKLDLELGEFGLSEVVDDVIARHSQQLDVAGCRVELRLDRAARGRWDRHRLEQVLVNLLSNAMKYAPAAPIRVTTTLDGDHAVLVVEDSGSGIPSEQQKRIFERFERANRDRHIGGLGLGLFIVRKIVEAHRGSVRVESAPGHGARFTVELPVKSPS
ncbi:MAG: PAS domain S-box protein, partial [Deltaproteobacteria bacterium]|nr:PAS domain S-box protein [Deltaproteobacteria bacterium]